ncbi:toxin-antitoxin system YwqK family antitoxin [Aquimarina pacifica]|uniref:toxin-antitoxin system YwqK family antitoxin n=1 Tax=Aquimarina pacifica TaxID=1296415 RepID=UPI00047284F8|nr:hypothetical protein [Aquimarina pacifica]
MFPISKVKYFFLFLLLYACQSKVITLNVNDSSLALVNGIMLYQEKPYSGILFSKNDTLTIYKAMYKNGKKHGKEQKFFYNGDLAELKFYTQGEKSGTHQAWWNKDQLKSEYHYDNAGKHIGVQHEWYSNGQLLKEFNYNANGEQEGMQKLWGFSGNIKANYEVIHGKSYGLVDSKSCKSFTDFE